MRGLIPKGDFRASIGTICNRFDTAIKIVMRQNDRHLGPFEGLFYFRLSAAKWEESGKSGKKWFYL